MTDIFLELDSVESLDLLAENESLKKQNEELHQLLANQQSDYANLSNQLSNQNEKLVDAKEATETRFETLFNNLQQRNEFDQVSFLRVVEFPLCLCVGLLNLKLKKVLKKTREC